MNPFQPLIDRFNSLYKDTLPFTVLRDTVLGLALAWVLYKLYKRIKIKGIKNAFLGYALEVVKFVPLSKKITQKVKLDLQKQLAPDYIQKLPINYELPKSGVPPAELLETLTEWSKKEITVWGRGKSSGAIYHGDLEKLEVATQAYSMFALSNPLHPDLFPYVRKLESEVIRMTISLFRGTMTQCGAMTSGGTESILMAIKAYRDQGREKKGIIYPELIVPSTAHAAFDKACGYFQIKQIIVPVDPLTQRVDPKKIENLINKNTIAIVGSAPTFPHGVIDPIPELSQIALKYGVGLHVDCCLGSYLIPFARILGYPIPDFDFILDGVTSISVDTHKYGYSPKGSSVIMFRNEDLRHFMYYVSTGWVGGVYASPTIAGSRPGAIVASTWATIMSFGYDGYKSHAVGILTAADLLRKQIRENKFLSSDGKKHPNDLIIVGDSKLSVVSFGFRHQVEKNYDKNQILDDKNQKKGEEEKKQENNNQTTTTTTTTRGGHLLDIYSLNSAISKESHWHLNTLQNPACIHLCVTHHNHGKVISGEFLQDLYKAIEIISKNPSKYSSNQSTQLYGVAEAINIDEDTNNNTDLLGQDQNNRKHNIAGELAMAYIDTLTWLPTPEEDKIFKKANLSSASSGSGGK